MDRTDLVVCLVLIVFCMAFSLILDWNKFIYKRGYFDEFLAVLKYVACITIMLGFVVFIFRLGNEFSRLVFGAFVLIDGLLTYIIHIIYKKWLWEIYRKSANSDKVTIITFRRFVDDIIKGVHEEGEWSCEVNGIILLDEDDLGGGACVETIEGIPIVAKKNNIDERLGQLAMDIAFLYVPGIDEQEKAHIIDMLETMGVACYLSLGRRMNVQNVGKFAGHTVISYEHNYSDIKRRIIKRLFDIFGSIIGIAITLVIFPFVAIAIKIDSPGPVIFRQQRIGKNGRRFYMYKFRSMYIDAEKRKAELEANNEMEGLMFKMEDDPRITRVGKFIRKTSMDELPQFVNILLGDMSLIGTRPPTVDEFEQYSLHYRRRLSITPGLTGMWQVSGRSDIKDFNEVVALDLEYIDNFSLTLDMKILVKTIAVVFKREGSK